MNREQSICIWYENLAATSVDERLPLSALDLDEHGHVHGCLRLQFQARFAPHLGYFGPDDACFNTWLDELWAVARAFDSATEASYTFDEGEQGQPAFLFERAGHRAYFSIIDSELSYGEADPDWQRVEFSPQEFLAEHARFRESFFATIRTEAPQIAEEWIREYDPKFRQR